MRDEVDRYGTVGVRVDRYGTMGMEIDKYGLWGWGLTGMDYEG